MPISLSWLLTSERFVVLDEVLYGLQLNGKKYEFEREVI